MARIIRSLQTGRIDLATFVDLLGVLGAKVWDRGGAYPRFLRERLGARSGESGGHGQALFQRNGGEEDAMTKTFAGVALLAALFLSSCSYIQVFRLYNNADGPVRILLSYEEIPVAPGGHAPDDFPVSSVLEWSRDGTFTSSELVVSAAHSCILTFRLDQIADQLLSAPCRRRVLPMQLEANFDLYFLPPGARLPAQAADLVAAREQGMFVQPRVSNCAAPHR